MIDKKKKRHTQPPPSDERPSGKQRISGPGVYSEGEARPSPLLDLLEAERAKTGEVYELRGALLHELDAIVASWNMRNLGGQQWTRVEVLDTLIRWANITDADLGGDPARICNACDGVGVTS